MQTLEYKSVMPARCADAVATFLAEAAALAARKPHVLHEAQQAALGSGLGRQAPGFSLLATAALQQAVKVASSAKMPAHARAAICGYVAGWLLI